MRHEPSDLPLSVRGLIARHVDSVQQVEILALLAGEPDATWTARDVSRRLRIRFDQAVRWLDEMAAAGLVAAVPRSGYRHRRVETVDELVRCYSTRRVALLSFIYSEPKF